MGRWRTVFGSSCKRVLVRRGDGPYDGESSEWVGWALQAGLAVLAVYLVWVVVSRLWPWLLGIGAAYVAFALRNGAKSRR